MQKRNVNMILTEIIYGHIYLFHFDCNLYRYWEMNSRRKFKKGGENACSGIIQIFGSRDFVALLYCVHTFFGETTNGCMEK